MKTTIQIGKGKRIYRALSEAMSDGRVFIENGEYVGRASDGVIVSFGLLDCPEQVERYLQDNPNPEQW